MSLPFAIGAGGEPVLSAPADVDLATTELLSALREIHAFAARFELDPWTSSFARAITIGTSLPGVHPPEADYQTGIFPNGWKSGPATRLLRTAYASAVFGGLGTWNDIGVPSADAANEMAALSELLFRAMLVAVVAAVNF